MQMPTPVAIHSTKPDAELPDARASAENRAGELDPEDFVAAAVADTDHKESGVEWSQRGPRRPH